MNKKTLVEVVQKGLGKEASKAAAERALQAVLEGISKGLKKDREVQLIGFGTFSVRNRKPRVGRNPRTGATIEIPASKTVAFRAGKELKLQM